MLKNTSLLGYNSVHGRVGYKPKLLYRVNLEAHGKKCDTEKYVLRSGQLNRSAKLTGGQFTNWDMREIELCRIFSCYELKLRNLQSQQEVGGAYESRRVWCWFAVRL